MKAQNIICTNSECFCYRKLLGFAICSTEYKFSKSVVHVSHFTPLLTLIPPAHVHHKHMFTTHPLNNESEENTISGTNPFSFLLLPLPQFLLFFSLASPQRPTLTMPLSLLSGEWRLIMLSPQKFINASTQIYHLRPFSSRYCAA